MGALRLTYHNSNLIASSSLELANHLGNVLSVISDKPIPHPSGSTVAYYKADILQSQDYSPFGVKLKGRNLNKTGNTELYRSGFQGQEEDDELKGDGNSVNYTYRMHDPRLGRFFAIDPLASKYPHNSPYAFSENVVIDHIELEGLEKAPVKLDGKTVVATKQETSSSGKTTFTATYKNGDVRTWVLKNKVESIWSEVTPVKLVTNQKLQTTKKEQPFRVQEKDNIPIVQTPQSPSCQPLTFQQAPLDLSICPGQEVELSPLIPPAGSILSGADAFAKEGSTITVNPSNGKVYENGWNGNKYVKTEKYFKDAKFFKKVSKRIPVIGAIMDATEIIQGFREGGTNEGIKQIVGAAGSFGGGAAGAWTGAAIGTAICPGIGTAIGALIGGIFGSWLGENAAEGVVDL